MFTLIQSEQEIALMDFLETQRHKPPGEKEAFIAHLIEDIRERIPLKKRVSYGRYSIVRELGIFIYSQLEGTSLSAAGLGRELFSCPRGDSFVRSLAIQLLTIEGEKTGDLSPVLVYMERAASDADWIVRECSSGFVRKLVRKYPEIMARWYESMVTSPDPLKRRFACESLRPVADNRWLRKQPDFAFAVLEHLYEERDEYPRTSCGNSLSDWMRIDEERTLPIIKMLARSGNSDSWWIAHRACRNLVKKNPDLVMDILGTDKYIYKDRRFFRKENP